MVMETVGDSNVRVSGMNARTSVIAMPGDAAHSNTIHNSNTTVVILSL